MLPIMTIVSLKSPLERLQSLFPIFKLRILNKVLANEQRQATNFHAFSSGNKTAFDAKRTVA